MILKEIRTNRLLNIYICLISIMILVFELIGHQSGNLTMIKYSTISLMIVSSYWALFWWLHIMNCRKRSSAEQEVLSYLKLAGLSERLLLSSREELVILLLKNKILLSTIESIFALYSLGVTYSFVRLFGMNPKNMILVILLLNIIYLLVSLLRAIYYCKEYLIFHKRLYPKKIHYKIELEERAHEVKNLKDIEYLPFTIRNGNLEELPEEVVYKKKSWWKKNSK